MVCPYCNNNKTRCIDSRQWSSIRYRKYRCDKCGKKFQTSEKVVPDPPKEEYEEGGKARG